MNNNIIIEHLKPGDLLMPSFLTKSEYLYLVLNIDNLKKEISFLCLTDDGVSKMSYISSFESIVMFNKIYIKL